MKKNLLTCFFAGLLLSGPALAQDTESPSRQGNGEENSNVEDTDNTNRRFWQASVPGGHYMVAIDRIASISMHEYVLDAKLIVNEVVVDTNGRGLARFYHVAPVGEGGSSTARQVVEKGQELLDRAGQHGGADVHNMAQKNYPATSHAGMIEYRILDFRDLQAIYNSLKSAWEAGRGRKITVK